MSSAVPMVVFAKGAHYALSELSSSGYDVVGLDWTMDPETARSSTASSNICLQGNLDPCLLFGTKELIEKETERMLRGFGNKNVIANLGHGMMPEHTPESLGWYVDAVHSISERIKSQEQ